MLIVRNFFDYLAGFYPNDLRKQIRREIPALSIATSRLALEVFDAENRGITFAEAVLDPSFPLMGRVHFGVGDTLMQRLDPRMVRGMRKLARHAASGDFDPIRQLTFVIATRKTAEGALCRFSLWEAIRLNLLVATWDQPMLEVTGCIAKAASDAETILGELLADEEMLADDVRPLNVLVQAAAECLERSVERFRDAIDRYGHALHEMLSKGEYLGAVRQLDARSAAALWPGESYEDLGSQRIADRYPQHFPTANAVEAQRSRSVRKMKGSDTDQPRLIDLLQEFQAEGL